MYRIAGSFACANFCEKASRLFRRNSHGFYFHGMRDALTTPLLVDVTSSERLLRFCWYMCILYSRRLSIPLQQPFRGQTDCREPSCSHGYSTYACNDIINFHLSMCFLLSRKQVCPQKNLHPAKNFPLYDYHMGDNIKYGLY